MYLPRTMKQRQLAMGDGEDPTDRLVLAVAPELRSALKGDRKGLGRQLDSEIEVESPL
jgi:hypothetical protein